MGLFEDKGCLCKDCRHPRDWGVLSLGQLLSAICHLWLQAVLVPGMPALFCLSSLSLSSPSLAGSYSLHLRGLSPVCSNLDGGMIEKIGNSSCMCQQGLQSSCTELVELSCPPAGMGSNVFLRGPNSGWKSTYEWPPNKAFRLQEMNKTSLRCSRCEQQTQSLLRTRSSR